MTITSLACTLSLVFELWRYFPEKMHYQNDEIEVSTNLLLIRAVVFSLFQVVEPCIINKYFAAEPKRLIYSLIYKNFKEPVRKLAEPGLKSTDLESPKSQILRSLLELIKRLEGLRSRCNTLAEWMYLRPRKIWKRQKNVIFQISFRTMAWKIQCPTLNWITDHRISRVL